MYTASKEFQNYAYFSVQVDQYYAATCIFSRHYDALKASYQLLPTEQDWPTDFSCLTERAASFFQVASRSLNYMGATQIFAIAPFPELTNLTGDIINFGFYTCYCFQWTLFENFVKQGVLGLANAKLLPENICNRCGHIQNRTEQFLKFIDSGKIFGHSPFQSVLPIQGYIPKTEEISYADLDLIRVQRNKFIHAVTSPEILPNSDLEKERSYKRSMWILRMFAGNIDQAIYNVRTASHPQPS